MSDEFSDNANAAIQSATYVVEGVGTGLLIMTIPLLTLGFAVAVGVLLVRTPLKAVGRVGGA